MFVTDSENRSLCVTDRNILTNCCKKLWKCRNRYNDSKTDPVDIRDEEKQVMYPLLEKGYEIVGRGAARIVLRVPNSELVVKLGRFGVNPVSIGMWQNHNEVKVWSQFKNDYPLAPIFDWDDFDFRWVVMPYGQPLTDIDTVPEKEFTAAKKQLSRIPNLSEEEFTEPNFILYKNRILLSDFGSLDSCF